MKKTMKTMLAFVAGALALSACSNEDILGENENNGAKLVTLTAYQEGDDVTKATIDATDSKKIDWTANDKINYFGGATGQSMTLKTGAGTTSGTFEGTVTTGSDDYVLYPYNAEATCISGTITTTIPSAQSVPAGSFDPIAALMVGKVNGTSVQFYNAVGYIAIKIPAGSSNITKMVITGNNNERLSGKVTISGITTDAAPTNIAGTTRTITDATSPTGVTDGVKYVEVTPNGTSTFTAGSTYYVAVAPDATLSKGIYVLLYDGSTSAPATLKLAVKKSSNSLEMARNKVKKVTLPTIANDDWKAMIKLTDAVGTGNIYMAPFNLGATASTGKEEAAYGNYYPFGEVDTNIHGVSVTSAYTGTAALTGLTDAATSNWGPDWRMATDTEWSNNRYNYTVKNLPPAGFLDNNGWNNRNIRGYYWSANPYSEADKAYRLIVYHDGIIEGGVGGDCRGNGNTIRPILVPATTGTVKATINGNQVDVPWVQLWAGGPKWAVYNVGATSPAEVGGYYAYGASEAYTASNKDTYSSENNIQGTSYDTAKNLWGSNWQMPTYQDCTNLISTTYTDGGVWKTAENSGYGVAGLLVTGKGDYQSNKVFFPASGYYNGDNLTLSTYSTCWAPGGSGGMCLFAEADLTVINTFTKDKGLPVRAIVKE